MVKVLKVIELDLYNKLMEIFQAQNYSTTCEEGNPGSQDAEQDSSKSQENSLKQIVTPSADPPTLEEQLEVVPAGEMPSEPIQLETKNVTASVPDYWITFEDVISELKKRNLKKRKRI